MLPSSRRRFLRRSVTLAAVGVLSGCGLVPPLLPSLKQSPARVPRVGMLLFYSDATALEPQAFLRGMREAGYVEGQSVVFEYRLAEGRSERLPGLATELVNANVDVIWTFGTPASVAARDTTSTTPVVFVGGGDPVALGLIQSLGRPGGNLTGVTVFSTILNRKRLEMLKEAAPRAGHVALLLDATSLLRATVLEETRVAGRALGTDILPYEARTVSECVSAFEAAKAAGADALLVQPSPLLLGLRSQIADLARDSRLPGLFPDREYVEAGGLLSYGPNAVDAYHGSAAYVDKILKGARPADLPVAQPTQFELVVNLRAAQALGLTIPPSVVQQATEVIQ